MKIVQKLSGREQQVIDYCASGLSNEDIARQMGVKIGTVNTYWLRIKQKVGGLSRTDSVLKVMRGATAGMVDKLSHLQVAAIEILKLIVADGQTAVWATDTDLRVTLSLNSPEDTGAWWTGWRTGELLVTLELSHRIGPQVLAMHRAALGGQDQEAIVDGEQLNILPLRNGNNEIIGTIALKIPTAKVLSHT